MLVKQVLLMVLMELLLAFLQVDLKMLIYTGVEEIVQQLVYLHQKVQQAPSYFDHLTRRDQHISFYSLQQC